MSGLRPVSDFDCCADQALNLFDTQPLPTFGAILAGPASTLDAHPEPRPVRDRRGDLLVAVAAGAYLLGALSALLILAVAR